MSSGYADASDCVCPAVSAGLKRLAGVFAGYRSVRGFRPKISGAAPDRQGVRSLMESGEVARLRFGPGWAAVSPEFSLHMNLPFPRLHSLQGYREALLGGRRVDHGYSLVVRAWLSLDDGQTTDEWSWWRLDHGQTTDERAWWSLNHGQTTNDGRWWRLDHSQATVVRGRSTLFPGRATTRKGTMR